jgi:hypothetical protein
MLMAVPVAPPHSLDAASPVPGAMLAKTLPTPSTSPMCSCPLAHELISSHSHPLEASPIPYETQLLLRLRSKGNKQTWRMQLEIARDGMAGNVHMYDGVWHGETLLMRTA